MAGLACFSSWVALDAAPQYAIGLKASSLGAGIEAQRSLTDTLNWRVGVNAFSQDEDYDDGGINYSGELDLFSVGSYLDWHPFQGGFRISGGLLYNGNEITLTGKSTAGSVTIGGSQYTLNGARLDGDIEFNSMAPYLGLGWGNVFDGGKWSFLVDLGVMFQGSPDADLRVTNQAGITDSNGNTINTTVFQSDLSQETAEVESDIESLQYYPVLSVGVTYRF